MSSITSKIIKIHHKLLEILVQLFPNFVTLPHITQVSPVDVQKMSISDIGPILWMSVGEPSNIPTAETEIQRMYFF